jgi:membrane-anchored protein YejM (alkaline phosphatase superfamily)
VMEAGKTRMVAWYRAPDRRPLTLWGTWYFYVVSIVLGMIALRYVMHLSPPREALAGYYAFAAYTTHFATMGYGAWFVLVLPLTLIVPLRKLIAPFGVLLATTIMTLLLLDTLVFGQNQFHINALTMKILGWKTWGFGIIYFFILLAFNSFLAKFVWDTVVGKPRKRRGGLIATVLVVMLISTHILHAWADAAYYVPITRFTHYLPLFYPTTAKGLIIEHGWMDLEQARERQMMKGVRQYEGVITYPLAPLKFSEPAHRKNLVLILADSLRPDMVPSEYMPNVTAFAEDNIAFENHFSGGNSTRMGSFSVFYGLPCTYWKHVESIQRTPVVLDRLQERDYQVGIFAALPLYRLASLDRTAFAKVPDIVNLDLKEFSTGSSRDREITDRWTRWMDSRETNRPFFTFLFYDNPCAANVPVEYDRRIKAGPGATKAQALFAKYKSGAGFADSLIAEVLAKLKKQGLWDDTVVIISGDHSHEYDDCGLGFIGHGSNYSRYQVGVPLVIHWPGKSAAMVSRRTSHNDLAATLMTDLLGCENPPSDYCSGQSLFSDHEWDWLVVGSYHDTAIMQPDQVTINYVGGYFEVRDNSYRVIEKPRLDKDVIMQAMNESRRFLKK